MNTVKYVFVYKYVVNVFVIVISWHGRNNILKRYLSSICKIHDSNDILNIYEYMSADVGTRVKRSAKNL